MADVGITTVTTGPRATYPGRRIVITTWGYMGELHPYLAIGLGLKALGHDVILGTTVPAARENSSLGSAPGEEACHGLEAGVVGVARSARG